MVCTALVMCSRTMQSFLQSGFGCGKAIHTLGQRRLHQWQLHFWSHTVTVTLLRLLAGC
jgi:hypothetical protein